MYNEMIMSELSVTIKTQEITISHIGTNGAVQTNEEHQRGVAQRAERFAAEFGLGDCGRLMGLLHDKGKEQKEWQKDIQRQAPITLTLVPLLLRGSIHRLHL